MNLSNWLRIPVGAIQLATHAKAFAGNPVIGSRRLNELGLHTTRRRFAARMAAYRRRQLARHIAPAELAHFDSMGFFIRHEALPEAHFQALRAEVMALRTQGWEMRQGKAVTRRVSLDSHVLRGNRACGQLVRDAGLRALIAYAASSRGDITCQIQSVIVDNSCSVLDPQTQLHSDTFHATAKAWLFLHDVDTDDGPFSYVPGSHKLTPARLNWEYQQSLTARESPEQMHREGSFRINEGELAQLDLPSPVRFTVPANTLVVADTSGFHARTESRRPSHRVEIYGSLRRNPFVPWCGLHAFSLPFVSGHHTALDIKLRQASRSGANGDWQAFDDLNAYDLARI
ncbi:phytanoyl-CoA dioxygenase family protein [Niveibacterium sp. SC-1]|uniref:phytanoyl-CoA dioxygenase family protein n=1 Tax=Niveibacterium sp. SC-1 TaxID=3135646 RepID=UPI00311E70B7